MLILNTDTPESLDVDTDASVAAPPSLPLCVSLNARSVYNKVNNLKDFLDRLGVCVATISERWERPHHSLPRLLGSPNMTCVSFCRGRDDTLWTEPPVPKTSGGAAILYNHHTFWSEDAKVGVTEGVEALWTILTPKTLDSNLYSHSCSH